MRGEHVFLTINGDEMTGYGNLKILTEKNGLSRKYGTIGRNLSKSKNREVIVDGIKIKKVPVIRGTKHG